MWPDSWKQQYVAGGSFIAGRIFWRFYCIQYQRTEFWPEGNFCDRIDRCSCGRCKFSYRRISEIRKAGTVEAENLRRCWEIPLWWRFTSAGRSEKRSGTSWPGGRNTEAYNEPATGVVSSWICRRFLWWHAVEWDSVLFIRRRIWGYAALAEAEQFFAAEPVCGLR